MRALLRFMLLAVVHALGVWLMISPLAAPAHAMVHAESAVAVGSIGRRIFLRTITKRACGSGSGHGSDGDGDTSMESSSQEDDDDDDSSAVHSDDSRLEPAPEDQVLAYDYYRTRGENLVRYMYLSAGDVDRELIACKKLVAGGSVQSRFQKYSDLKDHGWSSEIDTGLNSGSYGSAPIHDAVSDLHLSTFFERKPGPDELTGDKESTFPGQNTAISWTHAYAKIIDGKTYHPTDASYENVYNTREGVIVAYQNEGPQHRIDYHPRHKYEHGHVQAPALQKWSDVTFLEYAHQCTKEECELDKLRYVFQAAVTSKDLRKVVNHILEPDKDDNRGVTDDEIPSAAPPWNPESKLRKTYHVTTEQGHALLGTSVGVGVGWLLISHKEQLGNLKIKRVTLFESQGRTKAPSLLFEIQKATTPATADSGQPDYGLPIYWTNKDGDLDWKTSANVLVPWQHRVSKVTMAEMYNVYNAVDGLIIAHSNFGPEHQIKVWPQLKHKYGDDIKAPPLKHWSDIAFLTYQHEAVSRGLGADHLKYIVQARVCNAETRAMLINILALKEFDQFPGWSERKIMRMDSENGQAILATPNGSGVAWLLIGHKAVLGRKRVKSVTVYADSGHMAGRQWEDQYPSLVFELEDNQQSQAARMPSSPENPRKSRKGGVRKPVRPKSGGSGSRKRLGGKAQRRSDSSDGRPDHDVREPVGKGLGDDRLVERFSALSIQEQPFGLVKRASGHTTSETSSDDNTDHSGKQGTQGSGSRASHVSYNAYDVHQPASEAEVAVFVAKGHDLMQWISETAKQATQSMRQKNRLPAGGGSSQSFFTRYEQIGENGWAFDAEFLSDNDFDFSVARGYAPVIEAFEAMGPPSEGAKKVDDREPNKLVCWQHKEAKVVDGKQHHPTLADYCNVYNTANGVIVGFFNFGPRHIIEIDDEVTAQYPGIEPPPLHHWSDIAFLDYQHHSGGAGGMDRLKYSFQSKSKDVKTRELLLAVLRLSKAESWPTWEHKRVFSADTDEFRAILASPNGVGVAWLLINHTESWPRKRVKSVTVYADSASVKMDRPIQYPTLIFELEDAPHAQQASGSRASTSGPSSDRKEEEDKDDDGGKERKKRPRPPSGFYGKDTSGRYEFRTRPRPKDEWLK